MNGDDHAWRCYRKRDVNYNLFDNGHLQQDGLVELVTDLLLRIEDLEKRLADKKKP